MVSLLLFSGVLMGQVKESAMREGQDALYRLDYDRAEEIFRRMTEQSPEDPAGYGMLAITAWNRLLFAAKNLALDEYATPNPFTGKATYKPIFRERQLFEEANQRLLTVCDRRLERNPQDVSALYFKGLHYENISAEAIAVSKQTGRAFEYGKRAKNYHDRVLQLDPAFEDAKISPAIHEFAKATLPWSIKWLAYLLGLRGDKEGALRRLREVAEKGKYRSNDARVVLALLHAWKGNPQVSVSVFEELSRRYPSNYLLDLNLAAVQATKLNNYQASLDIYQRLLRDLPSKGPGLSPAEVYYRIGVVHFRRKDYSLALEAFQQALSTSRGERETEPLTYYHLAQIHRERGQGAEARRFYEKVVAYDGPTRGLEEVVREARRALD